ncbi:DUF2264 domain-containing protein [Isoptericola sp. NPDC057191]|uniref:DUF2264 domain-containing protein n=1 Tax=Isoptericola sp. NPDC057191 TaxID=3346041 RepID=UPI0036257948
MGATGRGAQATVEGRTGHDLAPITGWTRERWAELADGMLLAVRPYASAGHARVVLPGAPGGLGTDVDALEGFARTFLAAGFRLAGERGDDPLDLAGWYAEGLAAGTDPSSPERWLRPDEHGQAKVEAASIALVLDLTRPWLWDRLDPGVQERVVDYLATVVGDEDYPDNNWLWFRVVVEQFLRSVGGPWSLEDMERDLARHEDFCRADGWYSDGPRRAYDHYVGWAMHLYPVLWSRMAGAQDLAAPRTDAYVRRLDRFLADAVHLVGADGSPLLQGRSLVYRFAAAAPFWVGALVEVPSTSPGLLRRAASGVVGHFAQHGAPDERGLLTLGWHHEWRAMAQSYSGTGSPYWASKGLLGLSLPADHPVWAAAEEPLPVECGDTLLVAGAPGWAVAGTQDDGVVRVYNHGTDHAFEGDETGDSPLYARLGYSTATSPLLDDAGWSDPLDQSVVLLDAEGRATHRTGFRTLEVRLDSAADTTGDTAADTEADTEGEGTGTAVLASRAHAHWLDEDPVAFTAGSGRAGRARAAGTVTTVSVVRGAWEVRLARVEEVSPGAVALRVGGWPVTGEATSRAGQHAVRAGTTTSTLRPVPRSGSPAGDGEVDVRTGVATTDDGTPLGPRTATPWVTVTPVPVGEWCAVVVGLHGSGAQEGTPPLVEVDVEVEVEVADGGREVLVRWADGVRTRAELPAP